jgi:hypothetical protein
LRRQHAESWAAEIHDECMSLRKTALPKSTYPATSSDWLI